MAIHKKNKVEFVVGDEKHEAISAKGIARKTKLNQTVSPPVNTTQDAIQQIRQIESMILESNLHLNQLLLLITWIQPQNPPKTIYTSLHALTRLFSHFHEKGYLKPNLKMASDENTTEEAAAKVAAWLKKQWITFEIHILQFLQHPDTSIQLAALEALLKLLSIKCQELHLLDPRNLIDCDYIVYILPYILKMETWSKQFNETFFNYMFKFDDLRLYFFKTLVRYMKKDPPSSELPRKKDKVEFNFSELEHFPQFGIHLLQNLQQLPIEDQDLKRFLAKRKSIPNDHSVFSVLNHKHAFSEFILEYLSIPLTLTYYKNLLLLIPQKVMPYLVDPRTLMTFLTESYNQGGSISLLALQSVFELITTHNLDYPEFYKKLYNLFDENLFHVKFRSRFFRLFETFMASTHLPTYLIAAFIKRMARLALFAPPGGIMIVVPFIYNLLKDHPQCTCLLHRTDLFSTHDPYLMQEEDPMKSHAIESSLWELELLEKHYFPNLATLFKQFRKPFTKPHFQVEDFLDYNYANLFDSVHHSKSLKSIPLLNHQPPNDFFTKKLQNEEELFTI